MNRDEAPTCPVCDEHALDWQGTRLFWRNIKSGLLAGGTAAVYIALTLLHMLAAR
jgi:hypothetical protein